VLPHDESIDTTKLAHFARLLHVARSKGSASMKRAPHLVGEMQAMLASLCVATAKLNATNGRIKLLPAAIKQRRKFAT
jgi:hypothetical protein